MTIKENHRIVTLNEFIIQTQTAFPNAKGDFTRLLSHISIAAKIVNREVNKAGLVDILGDAGAKNIQGEDVKKLDIYADEQFIAALKASGVCCGLATEENQHSVVFDDTLSRDGKYIVCMDPLDGSSNIDVNVSIGTIFSIYIRKSAVGQMAQNYDFLQKGSDQVAAGYILYGSSTMLVYSTGTGVFGFTLDPSIGEFCLSHCSIQTPKDGKIYSINEGNYVRFNSGVKKYIKYCQDRDEETNRPYTSRYIGSLVADIHRNLLKGGVFLYPETETHPEGKLRLLYECNPIAFLVEQAGGTATSGTQRILDIEPESLHQRAPFYAGSSNMVEKIKEFLDNS